jgi:hypothetical protein
LSYYIDNLNRSIAEHQRIIDAGLPESAQAAQIIADHRAEINRVINSVPPPPLPPPPAAPYVPPAPYPTPPPPIVLPPPPTTKSVKQADPDIVIFNDEPISPELLLQLQYEDVAGIELINISRSDIIDGQTVVYSPIAQLSSLRRKFNPNNIIPLENSANFFSKFGIDLILRGIKNPYFDEEGNLVIEIEQVFEGELFEVDINTNGTINIVEYL